MRTKLIPVILALMAVVLISGCVSTEELVSQCMDTCTQITGIDDTDAEVLCKFNTNMDPERIAEMIVYCDETALLMDACIDTCSEAGVQDATEFCSLNIGNLEGALDECLEVLDELAALEGLEIEGEPNTGIAVLDGDTFVLGSGEIVDLIGINAPSMRESGFELSKEKLELFVLDKEVTLKEGSYPTDMFGRLPRYVYTARSYVNYHMINDGFAKAEIVAPDTDYRDLFTGAEAYAKANGKGLWVTGF